MSRFSAISSDEGAAEPNRRLENSWIIELLLSVFATNCHYNIYRSS